MAPTIYGESVSRAKLCAVPVVPHSTAAHNTIAIPPIGVLRKLGRAGDEDVTFGKFIRAQQSLSKSASWEFNVGLGRGWNAYSQGWVAKMIVSVPFIDYEIQDRQEK